MSARLSTLHSHVIVPTLCAVGLGARREISGALAPRIGVLVLMKNANELAAESRFSGDSWFPGTSTGDPLGDHRSDIRVKADRAG